ncbi:MAG: type II toxin-antitoxin system RelE/ParE family toxin [Mesorhizobium sp.]|nr:type II toxin-antitoxin system RelE/ParE family toxin [Mesorhizobium sp.]MCO5160889.1 type II toxin-antitoxin system RelE/ParE family toxin [Mesorhizobium sp.]
MIVSFRSRALQRFWERDDETGLNRQHVAKIARILDALDRSLRVEHMKLPGYRLHKLAGFNPDRWSVWVSGNWRITFSFEEGEALAVDYEDYH